MKLRTIPPYLLAPDSEPGIPDAEFQGKVLGGIEAQQKQISALEQKQTEILKAMPADIKATLAEIEKLKKSANDQQANIDTIVRGFQRFEGQMRQHVRHSYASPIQRIQADDALRTRFNLAVRMALNNQNNDLAPAIEPLRKALGEDSSPGSTVIDDTLAAEIYDTLATYGIWNTFRVQRLGTKETKFPIKTVRPIANVIVTEADTINDDTNKAGTSVTLTVELIAVLLNVSLQLLQDASIDVTRDVMEDFAEAYAYRLDWMCTQADGTADATDGGMTGIFGGGGTAVNAANGNTTIETTDEADWRNTILGVDPVVLARGARWWMHPQNLVRALAVKDNNGRSIFLSALEAPSAGAVGSILGYPVTLGLACPSTNSASAKAAVFGDPNGLVVGVRTDYQFEASDHHKWNTFQRSFRGTGRAGVKVRRAEAFGVLTLAAS